MNRFNTDSDKVSAAQDLVDRLHALAAESKRDAGLCSENSALFFHGSANAFSVAAGLLDELL